MSISNNKIIAQWERHIHVISYNKGIGCHSTRIELFYLDDKFCHIALWI